MRRRWTQEEETLLIDKWGQLSVPGIAKRLGRTEAAVKERARAAEAGPGADGLGICDAQSAAEDGGRVRKHVQL